LPVSFPVQVIYRIVLYHIVCVLRLGSANGLLLATDVAARGLDIPGVQHVIHYQVPRTTEVLPLSHQQRSQ